MTTHMLKGTRPRSPDRLLGRRDSPLPPAPVSLKTGARVWNFKGRRPAFNTLANNALKSDLWRLRQGRLCLQYRRPKLNPWSSSSSSPGETNGNPLWRLNSGKPCTISDPNLEAPPQAWGLTSNHFSEVHVTSFSGATAREQGTRHSFYGDLAILGHAQRDVLSDSPAALPFGWSSSPTSTGMPLELPDVGLHLVVAVAEVLGSWSRAWT